MPIRAVARAALGLKNLLAGRGIGFVRAGKGRNTQPGNLGIDRNTLGDPLQVRDDRGHFLAVIRQSLAVFTSRHSVVGPGDQVDRKLLSGAVLGIGRPHPDERETAILARLREPGIEMTIRAVDLVANVGGQHLLRVR